MNDQDIILTLILKDIKSKRPTTETVFIPNDVILGKRSHTVIFQESLPGRTEITVNLKFNINKNLWHFIKNMTQLTKKRLFNL